MNLWTEYIPADRIDTMLFPRLTAMAEALWTGAEERDFADFLDRLDDHRPVLRSLGVRPGAAARPLVLSGQFDRGRRTVTKWRSPWIPGSPRPWTAAT